MLTRHSSTVFTKSTGHEQDCSPSLSTDEPNMLSELIGRSRPGSGAYLLKIKDHLQDPKTFTSFLQQTKDLKDGKIDLPSFVRTIAETLHSSPELISESITILPPGCLLDIPAPKRTGSFIVTLRYPANTTIPIHVVCQRPSQETVGFFGHPGPTPTPSPEKSSLKRKRSRNLKRDAAVVFHEDTTLHQTPVALRQSKRLKLKKEADVSMRGSQSLSTSSKPPKLTVVGVVSLFTEVLSNRAKRRRLMEYKAERAQLVLDTMQALADIPDIVPSSRLKLKQGLVKLSAESSLSPSYFSLTGLDIDDFSPWDGTEGGFGEIYSGTFHQQRLCIKVVKLRYKSRTDKSVKAFLKEGVTWGQIVHPNILPFYGIYRLQDKYNRLSLVSPWLENGNVNVYLEQFPDANRILLVYDIIRGIAHLHNEGIIHGDLKGPNILVTKAGRACIADFGLATISYSEKQNWTSICTSKESGGTLRWQAPELLESELFEPTASSDVYAFGSIMYEIFTGQIPFYEIRQPVKVMKVMLEGGRPAKPAPMHVAWIQWGLTEKTWKLMQWCWEGNPEERPLANEVLKAVPGLSPNDPFEDTREIKNDEYLSPSAFRHAVHAKLNPLSEETIEKVVQWLREEEHRIMR